MKISILKTRLSIILKKLNEFRTVRTILYPKPEFERLFKDYNGEGDGRINIWFALRQVMTCSPELVRLVSEKAEEYKANTPITELLQKCLLRRIFYNKTEISASMSNDEVLKIFDLKKSSPILMLKDYFYDEENSPILFSVSFLNEKIINLSYIHNWKQ